MITVKNAFKKMDYEEALESNIESLEWIAEHNGQFGHFIGGRLLNQTTYSKPLTPLIKKKLLKFLRELLLMLKNLLRLQK